MPAKDTIDSTTPFQRYTVLWKLLGLRMDGSKYCLGLWDVLLSVGFTIGYPLHMLLSLFYSETMKEVFSNIVVTVAICACSIKVTIYRLRLRQMQQVQSTMRELDKRVLHAEEREYLQRKLLPDAFFVVNTFYTLYGATSVMSVIALIMSGEKRLLYPGWFPYDWHATDLIYTLTAFYQCFGLGVEAVQTLANDIFGPISLCIFAGHVHMLKIRLSKVGYDSAKSTREHNEDLIACIEDYRHLMSIYKMIQSTLSAALFTQFISGGLIISVSVIYIIFYVDDLFKYCYHILLLMVFLGELFPCCYYGSVLELEFRDLPYAIFCCNWVEQEHEFRHHAMIFTELTLRTITAWAGGMIRIHIDAFFSTCKMAYSFFALMITMQ